MTTASLPMLTDAVSDSSMGEAPPNYVSLMRVATARSDGMSIVSSALGAHNHFLRERPELLRRLYEPCFVGALCCTLNVERLRFACGLRARPRSWTLIISLACGVIGAA